MVVELFTSQGCSSCPPAVQLGATAQLTGTQTAPRLRVEVDSTAHDAVIVVALHQSGLETRIAAGENRGSAARNDYSVRRLTQVRGPRGTAELALDPAWLARPETLGIAAFVQDPETLAIHAATELAVPGVQTAAVR